MSKNIFDFDNDITKVRKILTLYIGELMEKDNTREDIVEAIYKNIDIESDLDDKVSVPIIKSILTFFIGTFFVGGSLQKIKASPNQIDIIAVLGIEFLFAFSQLPGVDDLNKRKEILKHYTFVNKYFLKHLELEFIEFFPQNNYDQGSGNLSLKKQFLNQGDYAFDEFFAYMLRQKAAQNIVDFLEVQSQKYKEDFVPFVKNTIIEYKDIFENKTIIIIENWVTSHTKYNVSSLVKNGNTIVSKQIEKISKKEPKSLPPPEGHIEVPGRLTQEELLNYLSFLWKEKNNDGIEFTTIDKFHSFVKYGPLVVPDRPRSTLIDLRLAANNSMYVIYYAFALLYKYHHRNRLHKKYFSRILKYNFIDFEHLDLKAISDAMRPSMAPPKMTFDIEKYLPERVRLKKVG